MYGVNQRKELHCDKCPQFIELIITMISATFFPLRKYPLRLMRKYFAYPLCNPKRASAVITRGMEDDAGNVCSVPWTYDG